MLRGFARLSAQLKSEPKFNGELYNLGDMMAAKVLCGAIEASRANFVGGTLILAV
jgi:hypothetical protein